jgi:predicted O-methyltransferase YrrM
LYGLLRHFRPRRVIEVGSGYSSAVMLDTVEQFLENRTSFTFIEPNPERLLSLLRPSDIDRVTLHATPVQSVRSDTFSVLQANDILFIDSSHVAKAGSDVVYLLNTIVPSLNPGVVVHIHDIFWPFEYPAEWLREGRAWNEIYMVRAFLQFNGAFRILLFNAYLAARYRDRLQACCPLALRNPGGSLWLMRTP